MSETRNRSKSVVFGLCSVLAVACKASVVVPEANRTPIADARVEGSEAEVVEVDFTGSPVQVTLDGSFSRDAEGKIKTYRWLSGRDASPAAMPAAGSGGAAAGAGAAGTAGAGDDDDAGVPMPMAGAGGGAGAGAGAGSGAGAGGRQATIHRWVPPGEDPNWPEDVVKPVVTLGEGNYAFVLWVIDEQNRVSEPSTVEVSVRRPLSPEVATCVAAAYDMAPPACTACVCGVDEACRMAANETVCGQSCWQFLDCLATRCPEYRPGGDTSCLATMCSAFLSGTAGAMMIGRCVTACAADCRGM